MQRRFALNRRCLVCANGLSPSSARDLSRDLKRWRERPSASQRPNPRKTFESCLSSPPYDLFMSPVPAGFYGRLSVALESHLGLVERARKG